MESPTNKSKQTMRCPHNFMQISIGEAKYEIRRIYTDHAVSSRLV